MTSMPTPVMDAAKPPAATNVRSLAPVLARVGGSVSDTSCAESGVGGATIFAAGDFDRVGVVGVLVGRGTRVGSVADVPAVADKGVGGAVVPVSAVGCTNAVGMSGFVVGYPLKDPLGVNAVGVRLGPTVKGSSYNEVCSGAGEIV
ncbi:hypothetical protein [Streptodolium elevatio]|uniref:Uncharacterized protein n=1 Tax=Streptodolium elevatio TaxID=3157996 RepID=A0ABV3DR79_9ACTN